MEVEMELVVRAIGTAVGIFVTLAGWFLIMGYLGRKSGCRGGAGSSHGEDALEYMAHGCAGCRGQGSCRSRGAREDHREST
jgi:hypothetical protein